MQVEQLFLSIDFSDCFESDDFDEVKKNFGAYTMALHLAPGSFLEQHPCYWLRPSSVNLWESKPNELLPPGSEDIFKGEPITHQLRYNLLRLARERILSAVGKGEQWAINAAAGDPFITECQTEEQQRKR